MVTTLENRCVLVTTLGNRSASEVLEGLLQIWQIFLEYLEIGIDLQILWMFSLNRWIVLQMMAVSSLMVRSGKRPFEFG